MLNPEQNNDLYTHFLEWSSAISKEMGEIKATNFHLSKSFDDHKRETKEDFSVIFKKLDSLSNFKAQEEGKSTHTIKWMTVAASAASVAAVLLNNVWSHISGQK